jgi:zinc transporter ZupT
MYSELEERKLQNADKAKKKGQPVQKGSAHGLPIILESPDHNEEGQPQSFGVERKSKWSFYWMLFAISIQAVFVGFGFAVQQFKYGIMFAAITIAMALQKWIEGLTIGWSFRKNGISLKPTLEYTLIYSLATPVGIIIGLLLAEYKMARGILMGIGGGTFIYISAVENMNLEFVTAKFSHRMLKYLTLVAGFLLICGCQFWEVRITGGSS